MQPSRVRKAVTQSTGGALRREHGTIRRRRRNCASVRGPRDHKMRSREVSFSACNKQPVHTDPQ